MTSPRYKLCAPITTLSQFLKCVKDEKKDAEESGNKEDFLFRGQRTQSALLPTLARLDWKGGNVFKMERLPQMPSA